MKKIVFFDGDGTLWYPKKTKREEKPHWIYFSEKTKKEPIKHLEICPTVLFTLKELKNQGINTVILSANPKLPKEADAELKSRIKYFGLEGLIDEAHSTSSIDKGSKGKFMLKILKRKNIPKNQALMVGDFYNWDYKPACDNGIDALILDSEYIRKYASLLRKGDIIKDLKDILNYV
jgi:phosphoglycolate phosphatase-like HAD superfamily hydrolase